MRKTGPDPGKRPDEPSETVTGAYSRILPELRAYIWRLLPGNRTQSDVEDIAQEVYLRAFSSKRDQKLTSTRAYLYRVARNLSFDFYGKKKRSVEIVVEDFVIQGVIDDMANQENALILKDRMQALSDAVLHLTPKCREAYMLRCVEGMSHKQIAATMGISTSTVEKHIAKAITLLARQMREGGHADQEGTESVGIWSVDREGG